MINKLVVKVFTGIFYAITVSLLFPSNAQAKNLLLENDCNTFNLSSACPKLPPVTSPPRSNFIRDELIILHPSNDSTKIKAITKRYNLKPIGKATLASIETGIIIAKTNGQNPLRLSKYISKKEKSVKAATNNTFQVASFFSSNAYSMYETGVRYVHKTTKGKGTSICMIDTPIDIYHPSLSHSLIDTIDLIKYNEDQSDSMLHGTAVAGILVSQNKHIGIAPQAKLFSVGVFSVAQADPLTLRGVSSDIAQALDICIQHNVDIINLSFTGGKDALVERLIKKAISKGIVVVAASGNNGYTGSTIYPALIHGVLTATAVDKNKELYNMANKGHFIDLAAPGVDVLTIAPKGKYRIATGTSLSSAHISGVIALLKSQGKLSKFSTSIKNTLTRTAIDLGIPGRDQEYGDGLISASRALSILGKK